MSTTASLFDAHDLASALARGMGVSGDHRLVRAFLDFHAANPSVYAAFDRFACEAVGAGFEHMSADMVMHRVRWETAVAGRDGEFKVNNNYVAYYGRLWMLRNPRYDGFFRTRRVGRKIR